MKKKIKVDLDPRSHPRFIIMAGLLGILALSLLLRLKLYGFITADYIGFLSPWYDTLKSQGLHAFSTNFANYNFPYLFLLFLTTLLPVSKLLAIKLISIVFDYLLAGSVYLIIKTLTNNQTKALIAAVICLFLPTVFINSSLWGQCDAIYTSFALLSFWAILKNRWSLAWTLFGVALAFKLQAIFFFPVIALGWIHKKGEWYSPAWGAVSFLFLSLPPILFGRSLSSTMSVYLNQYGAQPQLTSNAPTIYSWFPAQLSGFLTPASLIFAAALLLCLFLACYVLVVYNKAILPLILSSFLLLFPFILPQMHERYFFMFEISVLILAILRPGFVWVLVVSQVITLASYMPFLVGQTIIPLQYLSLGTLLMLVYLVYRLLQPQKIVLSNTNRF